MSNDYWRITQGAWQRHTSRHMLHAMGSDAEAALGTFDELPGTWSGRWRLALVQVRVAWDRFSL